MPKPSISRRWFLSAAIALLAIALVAAPLDFTPSDWDLSKSAAQAKGGGDKGGDRDGGKSASTKGSGKGGKDKGKGGKDGSKAKDWAKNKAQKRYAKALGLGVDGAGVKPGKSIHTFSNQQVKGLLGKNWKAAKFAGPGNHGQRVSTMVKLAKALGFGAWVGAMQANFGTMQELGIDDLQAAVDAATTALEAAGPAEKAAAAQALADAQAALDQAIADAKPGLGPKKDWATVNLDVDGDGVVDTKDLEAALALP